MNDKTTQGSAVYVDSDVKLPRPAIDALLQAAREFVEYHGWILENETGIPEPFEETLFYKVLAKHIGPLIDVDVYKMKRIEALKTELRILEG